MISFKVVNAMGRDGNEPFRAEELVALVEGVDVQFEYCEAEIACELLCRKISS